MKTKTTDAIDKQHADIDDAQRDRIAGMIDRYIDDVHAYDTRQVVIDELADEYGRVDIAYEIADCECECEIPFTQMNDSCVACASEDADDVNVIVKYLTPVVLELLNAN